MYADIHFAQEKTRSDIIKNIKLPLFLPKGQSVSKKGNEVHIKYKSMRRKLTITINYFHWFHKKTFHFLE